MSLHLFFQCNFHEILNNVNVIYLIIYETLIRDVPYNKVTKYYIVRVKVLNLKLVH
jgi:hypothetical protein